jgi:predicted peptidase
MLGESHNIKYATFLKGTVFPAGQEGGIEHMATWPVAYRIEGVRDWLFAQKKTSVASVKGSQTSRKESADTHIVDVTAITRVFADGLKVAAVAVQYDHSISDASLASADFTVQTDVAGQRITKAYTSNDGLQISGRALNGKYVILELSTDYVIPVPLPKVAAATPAARGAQPATQVQTQGQTQTPAQALAKESIVLNSEVVAQVGNISWDPAAHPATLKSSKHGGNGKSVVVNQTGEIATTDGTTLTATTSGRDNVYCRNLIIDGFMKPDFASATSGNVKYNIHFPKSFDPNKTYPMVVFLSDSDSPNGYTHAEYLIHGLGAVVWAEKEDEARNPAIVLVPTYSRALINENYLPAVASRPGGQSSTPYLSMLELLDAMMDKIPNVDRNRIYLTGQGDGARAALRMMADRPNVFAAALLFAPDYDTSLAGQLSKAKLWMVAAEADPASYASMEGFTASLKANGARVARAEWNGRADSKQLAAQVRSLAAGGSNIQYAVLQKGTVVAPGSPDDAANNHAFTWRIGYSTAPLRDWLFTQKRR